MTKEENLSKYLYKIELFLIKVIPIIMAGITFLNILLSYFYIDLSFLSYLGSNSILTLIVLYCSSYAFKFCKWHRYVLHYVSFNWLLTIYDYYIGIPISDRGLFILYMVISSVFLFLVLYFKYGLDNKTSGKTTKKCC